MEPIFLIWRSCWRKSSRVKASFRSFCSRAFTSPASKASWALLDEAEDVAHAQDAGGQPVRVEFFQGVQLFAHPQELDGFAHHFPHAQGRAAPGVAFHLGEDHAGELQEVVETLAHLYRVLAGHGVRHQQNLFGLRLLLDGLEFLHQRGVDVQPPGGVQDHRVIARGVGRFHGRTGDGHRILPRLRGMHRHADVRSQTF